jgi:hypothetical protein
VLRHALRMPKYRVHVRLLTNVANMVKTDRRDRERHAEMKQRISRVGHYTILCRTLIYLICLLQIKSSI